MMGAPAPAGLTLALPNQGSKTRLAQQFKRQEKGLGGIAALILRADMNVRLEKNYEKLINEPEINLKLHSTG